MKNFFYKVFLLVLLNYVIEIVYGFEVMDTCKQFAKGQIRAVLYYNDFKLYPVFNITSSDEITVRTDTKEFKYFDKTEQTINCKAEGNSAILKIEINPFDELYWWTKIGSENYSLEIPLLEGKNKLDTLSGGLIVGLGTKYQIFPETIVSPGICIDFGLTVSEYKFEKYYPYGMAPIIINNKLESTEGQMTLFMSKSLVSSDKKLEIEPYFGLKIFRNFNRITDMVTLKQAQGITDGIGIFLGSQLKIFPMEWIIFELGLLNEMTLSVGFGYGF